MTPDGGRPMFNAAPLGKNLESACKAYHEQKAARDERERWDEWERRTLAAIDAAIARSVGADE